MPRPIWQLATLALLLGAGLTAWKLAHEDTGLGTAHPDAAAAYREGSYHLYRFELDEAIADLQRSIEADSTFALAHLELGLAHRSAGDADAARRSMERAAEFAAIGATPCERLWIDHRAAQFRGDETEMDAAFETLQRQYPETAYAAELRAERARQRHDFESTRKNYEEVLRQHPERVDVHNSLGYAALEMAHYEEAVSRLKRYAFYSPDSANPHDSLGEIHLLIGDYHQSAREYLLALEMNPTFVSSAFGAADALMITGQLRRAERLLLTTRDLFAEHDRLPRFYLAQAQLLYASEQWDQLVEQVDDRIGREEFDTPSALGPTLWMRALQTLALGRLGVPEFAHARMDTLRSEVSAVRAGLPRPARAWREILELLEKSVEAAVIAGLQEEATRPLAELRSELDTSGLPPHHLLPFRTLLAESLLEYGLYEDALRVARDNLEFTETHPRSNLLAARALTHLGRNREAAPLLQTYLEVMRLADEGHPGLLAAHRLLEKVLPPSS